jgi:hypothetical protein
LQTGSIVVAVIFLPVNCNGFGAGCSIRMSKSATAWNPGLVGAQLLRGRQAGLGLRRAAAAAEFHWGSGARWSRDSAIRHQKCKPWRHP